MGEKIIVGPIDKGLHTDRTAFVIDNNSFPKLINAYQWRGRVKRKRGTSLLNRLARFFNSTSTAYNSGSTTITLSGTGGGNLITGFSLQTNGNIFPGTLTITSSSTTVYTDPTKDGYLTPTGTGGPNTINYASGAILIPGEAGNTITAKFVYYPSLPALGERDIILGQFQFPGTMGFDTTYAYNIQTFSPYGIYSVSFYKNPLADGTLLPGYIPKMILTPTSWNGQNYQQYWTVNYSNALWATNGITVPFTTTNIGMQFKAITAIAITTATNPNGPSIATITIPAHGLVQGDFVFINEVVYSAPNLANSINFQTGYVINVIDANNVSVEFPNAYLTGTYASGGIAQYLTNRSNPAIDCLRWYDGDPTNGSVTAPTLSGIFGWVNFAPPLSKGLFSIADLPPRQYYLVGARMILPFKDRIIFFGPVVQASTGNPIYLQDTVIYSQDGTPYYTSSFTGDPSLATTVFFPILVPVNQTTTANAYWEDQTGYGGFISVGVDQPITTVSANEDVLIVGLDRLQTRMVYTGNDIVPFNFYLINSELGSSSTFSVINFDKSVMTRGNRGYINTSQVEAVRTDLDIPDQIFQLNLLNNGTERVTAQRDFINEWVYITYPSNQVTYSYPNQTLQYNYRDQSWAIHNETYTSYGQFKKRTGFTWASVGTIYPTWNSWDVPWNSGSSTLLQPVVIAGNQQGFIMIRENGTGEGNSLYIQNIAGSVVTSPDHCLNDGDYIVISGVLGTVGTQVNGQIFSVATPTQNTFNLNPSIVGGTYFGGGLIKRMYVPIIQTKQFPSSWGMARKTRIGVQQYLLSTTVLGQITLLIFLSQNDEEPYNAGTIVPDENSINNSLIYSTVLYTCPESTNLGLTPANTNLQMITNVATGQSKQAQTWHRINTSLSGDTVQLGFTMSDAQMRDPTFSNQFSEIELHGFILDVAPSALLA